MTCSVFRKRLPDFLQGNLPEDMRNAFITHMDQCCECRELYENEVSLDNDFKSALSIDGVKFNSSRAEILKSIDKNRYNKKITNKLFFHFKRNKIMISTCAALVAILFFVTPYIGKVFNNQFSGKKLGTKQSAKLNSSTKGIVANKPNQTQDSNSIMEKKSTGNSTSIAGQEVQTKFVTKLVKDTSNIQTKTNSGTAWSNSPGSKLSISIVGKGSEIVEEGIAEIYVKDLSNNNAWTFTVPSDKNINQYSPKVFNWYDDNYIILVAGLGYGTVTKGGNLYFANMITGDVYPIFESDSTALEVTSVEKVNSDLQLKFNIYDDKNMTKYHTEDGIVKDFDPSKPGVIERHSKDGTVKFDKLSTPITK